GSVTAGLISNADYASMMAKQSNTLAAGQMWVGNASGVAQAFALSGDVSSVSNTGSVVVNKTTTGASNTILSLDGAGVANAYGVGVKGATSGTVTLQAAATTANYSLKLPATTPAANQVMQSDASGNLSWTTALSSSTAYVNGGNTFAGNATIGLNDNYNLGFKTNNTTKMTLTSDGKLGIGTATPNTALAIASGDITLDAGYSMMWGQSAYSFINGDSGPSSHLILGTSGAIVMTLDVNGNVGIGTNPAFTLDMGSRTDAIRLPQGTAGQQPANTKGLIRFNTTSNTVEYNNGSAWVTVAASLGYTPVNKAGDTMSGDLSTQNINIAAGKYLGLGAGSTAGTVAGQMWYDSGVIKYFDGTSTKSLGIAGSGITSLNGLTANVQSFAIGTSGNSPAFASATSTHTLNIPMASAASVTAGLLSNADYTSMMAKQSNTLAAGQMWVGNASGVAQAFALSGDVSSVSNSGSVVVNKTTTGASSTILSLDGSGVANVYGVGVKGATSGAVTLQAATTTANYSLKLPATTPTANQVMQSDASGNLSWVTALTSATGFINGGNTFAGNATIGLNDAYTLGFKTNNTTQMTLTAAGRLGIGTATPSGTLEVQGGTAAASVTGVPITLKAQNGGSGGAVGGSIYLTPGDGTSGWPGGTVVIATTGGQNGAISINNDKTSSYTSSASSTAPSYVMRLANSYNQNGNTALIDGTVKNSSALYQEGYMGFVSVSGAANYSPDFVLGLQNGSNSYQERIRVNGSTGNVGIGTSSPAATLDVVGSAAFENNTASTAAANFSFWKSRNYAAVQLNDNLGFFSYYGSDGSSQQRSAYISSTVDDTVATNSVPANLVFATTQAGGTDSTERMRITSGGNVGINTVPSGNAKLEVSGAIVSVGRSVASGATVNLAQGNTTVLASVGGSAITLQNMVNGGNYTLVITDTTSRTYTFTGCNSSKFSPANQATIGGTPSVYNILTIYNGSSYDCYITWSTGFQ
ncbi:MAG: hypothetical protein JSU04_17225, partial [Bdellovibrionales bacterium]|nr:hypothetical protein [Bdellovibrionales bacterium]